MQSEITRTRVIKVLFVAVLALLALSVLLVSRGPSANTNHLFDDMPEGDIFTSSPSPGQAGQEIPWYILPEGSYVPPYGDWAAQSWRYAADATVDLPLSSATLFFTAQGAGLTGTLNIQNDGSRGADVARVQVRMYYTAARLADAAKVLREQPAAGNNGIGIKTPNRTSQNEHMFFDVRVHLPRGTAQDPQRISNLEADLPNFAHILGDLADGVHFNRISLTGANNYISSKSLLADIAHIRTSNAAIEGHYIANSILSLNTDNGHVKTDVTLTNAGSRASTLDLRASNGQVTSTISLLSTSQDSTGGVFEVKARTSNGGIALSFPEAPLDSVQHVEAQSSIGDATVQMHKTFEGTFSLSQSFPAPVIQYDNRASDPAGTGRERNVGYQRDGSGAFVGRTTWGQPARGKGMGNVNVQTSIGNTKLIL
ncbi:uncharacterized protein PHACADRAFT_187392 [Phanerochaete carnosa HHB-10118-sp]|uniref:Uncharacterized protein n=1 Tax=Phanerochaete carnosa (strain HHB-10118-sp) TaxID=650164 RepID=K5VZI4_PHACS|nr:uncharacterized protein PHACADRAFT_187392 [Phanerochaete carnosa HHB-10118-sp]EKM52029.1 hypothetical protein PHACADRAFT_187392 [Phanerochaete carnosa HHB-10118-sp]